MAVTDTDETQADFAEGTLTDVEADSGDYLRLADTDVLSFDGTDDYVDYGDKAEFEFASGESFTIEFWQWQASGQESDKSSGSLITKGFGDPIGNVDVMPWYLSRPGQTGGVAEFFLRDSNDNDFNAIGSTNITDSWHHTAAVYDAGNAELRLYVDGMLESTITGVNQDSYGTNAEKLLSGVHSDSYGDFDMSDLRIWKGVARTQTEIQDNMNKRLNGDEPGLVAYYPLDEGTGTTATDSAGTNDGTINGATWVTDEPIYFMNSSEDNNRVSPQLDLSAVGTVSISEISWMGGLNSQTITIETRVSTDGGSTWDSWQTCTNGDPIPNLSNGDDVSNGLLECRQSLTTSDINATPQLDTLDLTINGGFSISGTVTDGGTAVENAEVVIMSADDDQMTNATILDVKQTDASGNWSAVIVEGKIGFTASFHKDASDNYYRAPGQGYLSEGA